MSRKDLNILNQKVDMDTLNMIVPAYKRLVNEYKSYMEDYKIEESVETEKHVEYIFNQNLYPSEDEITTEDDPRDLKIGGLKAKLREIEMEMKEQLGYLVFKEAGLFKDVKRSEISWN